MRSGAWSKVTSRPVTSVTVSALSAWVGSADGVVSALLPEHAASEAAAHSATAVSYTHLTLPTKA